MLATLLLLTLAGPAAAATSSVYETRRALDLPVTLAAGGGTLLVYALGGRLISRRCPCDRGEVNSIDRQAIGNHSGAAEWFSDAMVGAAVVGPVVADYYDVGWGAAFKEDMEVLAEALAVNAALVTAAKYSVQRPLPRTYEGEAAYVGSSRGYRSFYSGHASMAAAALTAAAQTARLRHGAGWLPWLMAVGFSAGVGIERVAAGKHFYSDVAVGVFMGSLVGTAVPSLHARGRGRSTLTLVPIPGALAATWSTRF